MIRHLFKLAWNRRRANALVLVELLACFLVLTGVFVTGLTLLDNWVKPLGFQWQDVWQLKLLVPGQELARAQQERREAHPARGLGHPSPPGAGG